jgi:hypothetical protein
MKLAILFIVIFVIAVLLMKSRRGIMFLWRFVRWFFAMKKMSASANPQIDQHETVALGRLIRCESCGVWIPRDRSVSIRSRNFFCSNECLEKTAKL